jgi:hypothetical protein
MADKYSTQMANATAIPRVGIDSRDQGKKRTLYFDYTVPVGNLAVGQTIALRDIPAGVRLLGGKTANTALSSAGGTAGISIGDGTTAAKYGSAIDMDAAGTDEFGNTIALYYGEYVSTAFTLTATVTGEALVAAGEIRGEISFLMP